MKHGGKQPGSPPSSRERVQRHRDAMRAQGYRTITLWVPDARRPGFAEECQRQSLLLRESAAEKRYLEELDLPEVEGWS
jgi:Protein  of unknown function (DUF3018)